MQILERLEKLPNNIFFVYIRQDACANHGMQIYFGPTKHTRPQKKRKKHAQGKRSLKSE